MHARVEPIVRDDWHQADEWGFYYRANANDPNSLSNHSSATALDWNATRHPNGVPAHVTFTTAQIEEIHKILAEVDHVVRWGGDYTGTPDAMHFEIDDTAAAVRAVADRLRDEPMLDADCEKIRTIAREEAERAVAKAGDLVKIDVGTKAKRSLATVLKEIRNGTRPQ